MIIIWIMLNMFYLFTGKVLKCPNVRHATVQFTDGEREVLTRFILPMSGAIACPPLAVSMVQVCPSNVNLSNHPTFEQNYSTPHPPIPLHILL